MTPATAERLLERQHELARLAAVAERAAGGAGGAVMVEGAPGIGKTSLLDAAAGLAHDHGLAVLRARGGELERALAFGVARDLLERRLAGLTDDERSRLFAGAAVVAMPALGLGLPDGPPAEEAAVNHGLTWLVADLADEQPLALIVDDVQWSDAASAAWLAHLARRIADLPVALLLAARPPTGEPEPPGVTALRELGDLERLRPEPLEPASVAALVRSFYAPEADDHFVAACHSAAGGNPFHTHALLDAAAAEAIPATAAGATALADLAPEAIRRSVAGALRRAGEDAEALAKACAVLGDAVELRHAAALAQLDATAASVAVDRLVNDNLLASGRPLSYAHPILLAAVREGMPAGVFALLNRAAADLFESQGDRRRAAAHLLEVEPAGDPDVVATLTAAASEAASEAAMTHAAVLLERALAEPPPDVDRPWLLGQLGRARAFARLGGAVEPLLAAEEAAASPAARAELLAIAAWATLFEAPELLGDVARRVAAIPPSAGEWRMRADAALAITLRWAGLPPQPSTAELVAGAEPLAGDSAAERALLAAAASSAAAEGALPAPRLLSLCRRALRAPAETHAGVAIAAAQITALAGAGEEALAPLGSAMTGCQRRGNQSGLTGLLASRFIVNWWLGRLREAEVDARTIWEMVRAEPPASRARPNGLFAMTWVLTARGLTDEAKTLLEQNPPPQRSTSSFEGDLLRWGAGCLALECGDLADAVELIVAFDQSLERVGMQNSGFGVPHRPTAVEAMVRIGDAEAARPLAEKDLRLARALGAPGSLGYALRGMGLVVGGPEGRELIEQGVPLLEQSGERDRLARTLLDLGRSLRLEGRPTDAREPLRRALELAEHCGAELVAQRAFDELRAAGAKPRRRALSGPDSLTPSEARVARLAAEGRTNREIAQTLFVSAKTVETHLGHVYGKLGIGGRGELAAAISEEP